MEFRHDQTAGIAAPDGLQLVTGRLGRQPARVHLLHGHSRVFPVSLLIGAAARRPVAVIDGATRFNSYTLSRIAPLAGVPAPVLLRRTHVTRSFTAFQTEAAVTTKLVRFLAATPCPLVIVLGLLDTFYDEQVKPRECRRSLDRIMRALGDLARRGTHVLIADIEVPRPPQGKERLFHLVRASAGAVLRLQAAGGGFQLYEERRDSDGPQQRYLYHGHRPAQGGMEQIPAGAEKRGPDDVR